MALLGTASAENQKAEKGKSIVVYFSRRGNNYVNGKIENLKVGNTEVIASKIKNLTGSDVFRILTVKDYPADYTECTNVARSEKNANARPAYKNPPKSIAPYSVVYLGYPNWWGTMPMAVWTFLEAYDFSGKTIIPFCTHEGSRMGSSVDDIKKLCPKAKVVSPLAIKGSNVGKSDKDVEDWIKSVKKLLHE